MTDFMPLTRHFDKRGIQHIILHGTEVDWPTTEAILRGQTAYEVSCHYAISQEGELVQYVDKDVRAWHSGVGYWSGVQRLNNSSIGFELECISKSAKFDGPESTYSQAQIDVLVPLVKDLMAEYMIYPWNVIGHQDMAPNRKWDPGIHFPWAELASHGIGLWHDLEPVEKDQVIVDQQRFAEFKRNLTFYGYTNDPAVAGENHVNVIKAFQTHFLPWNICGQATEQSVQALDILLEKKYGTF
jgi:N-acetyl-anhydromuramyl-L-alanine amidase AmpD